MKKLFIACLVLGIVNFILVGLGIGSWFNIVAGAPACVVGIVGLMSLK